MRWVVEIPDPSGGTAATVTVEAPSWLEGLSKARGGVALAKYHAEIDDDGLVRVLDRSTRDRFTVRPLTAQAADAGRISPPPDAPLFFNAPPPSDAVFNTGELRAALATPPPPAATSSPPAAATVEGKGTLLNYRVEPAKPRSEPPAPSSQPPAARDLRSKSGPPSSTQTAQVDPAHAAEPTRPAATPTGPGADATVPDASTLEAARAAHPSKPGAAEASSEATPPATAVVEPAPAATVVVEPAPAATVVVDPAPAATVVVDPAPAATVVVDPAPAATGSAIARGEDLSGSPSVATDHQRSDTLVVPTVTDHDGVVEPLPVPTVLFERDEDPSPGQPICYRERVFAVPSGTRRERAEALARQSFAAIKRALSSRPRGRFVSIAVFDQEFTSRPSAPPLVVLEWKDWRGDPTVQYPESLPAPEPVVEAPSARPASIDSAPAAAPLVVAAVTPEPAVGADSAKRVRLPTESDIRMVEVVPPPVPMAAIPDASDVSMVEVSPPKAPPPVTPAQAKPPEGKGKKDKKRKRNRTASESSIPTSVARQASAQTPAERDAPTVVVPVFQAPVAATAASMEPAKAEPAPVEPAKAEPAKAEPAKVEAAPAKAEAEPAKAEAEPAKAEAEPAKAEAEPAKVEAAPAKAEPAKAESAPAKAESAPAKAESAPAKAESAPAKAESAKVAEKGKARRSRALTEKRRRGKELVGDLFEALMDLAFAQSSEEACAYAARVLHEYVVCDACSVALYDIDHDDFVVSAAEGVAADGRRDKAGQGSRALAMRKRGAVNVKRTEAAEALEDFVAGGAAVFVPAYHRDRLFALVALQRSPGGPAFESDEEDGAAYVASQLAEALSAHSRRAGAKQLDDERRAISPSRKR